MLDATGQRAAELVEDALRSAGPTTLHHQRLRSAFASELAERLQGAGLLARCSCPVGFGQVRNADCPAHGTRSPAHTITGVPAGGPRQ